MIKYDKHSVSWSANWITNYRKTFSGLEAYEAELQIFFTFKLHLTIVVLLSTTYAFWLMTELWILSQVYGVSGTNKRVKFGYLCVVWKLSVRALEIQFEWFNTRAFPIPNKFESVLCKRMTLEWRSCARKSFKDSDHALVITQVYSRRLLDAIGPH